MLSTCLVLVGEYPTVSILIARCLGRWMVPFSLDLLYPPLWGVLCQATLAGTVMAYPFHLWMIRRGVIRWGAAALPDERAARGPAWFLQAALILLLFAAMLGSIFLST